MRDVRVADVDASVGSQVSSRPAGRFRDARVLVTGGTRGIGKAIATMFAREGARVAVGYLHRTRSAERTAEELRALGAEAIAVRGDLRDPARVAAMVDEVGAALDGLDVVISNAASGPARRALELDVRGWDWAMDANARALLLLAKAAVPWMRARGGGRIVAVSSLGSSRVAPAYAAIGASKAALESLARYLAVELGPEGIVVNCVSAGPVEGETLRRFPEGERLFSYARERTPARRPVRAEDVASVVGFLCSREASMIVGQVVVVDGGLSLAL